MRPCCPPGHGCNDPEGGEPCALELCQAAAPEEGDAALAVERWSELERALDHHRNDGEQRFRRRAFQRARDRALIGLAMKRKAAGRPRTRRPLAV
jgi:hypothetical protein